MDFHSKCNLGALSLAVLVVFSLTLAHGANEIITNTKGQNYMILNYGEPLKLICNVTNREPGLVMTWLKDDKPLHTSATERPNYVVKDDTVSIHRAMDDEVANYTCQLINPKNNNSVVKRAEIYVVGRPYVKLPETVTVVEEEKLKLECIVLGKPPPITVEWIIGNKSYLQSEGRVKLSSEKGIINNIMELEPAQMSDRGDFLCLADNIATTFVTANNATVYVRVKGKYAALWPFLGIVAEVIVLCAVIFIYEKKRNKAELEESDTDQSPEQKNTPDHGKESVRHRK